MFGLDPSSAECLALFTACGMHRGSARLRVSLSLAFYAEARLLTIWSVRPNGLRLAAAHSGLPGRRKTAYQVP